MSDNMPLKPWTIGTVVVMLVLALGIVVVMMM
jgi:hypothetical protein